MPNHNSKQYLFLKTFGVLIVIGAYLIGMTEREAIHESFHPISLEEAHSAINEQDPCHRNIYHHDQKAGCEHPTHLSTDGPCSLCGIAIHNEHELVISLIIQEKHITSDFGREANFELVVPDHYQISARAPPIDVA